MLGKSEEKTFVCASRRELGPIMWLTSPSGSKIIFVAGILLQEAGTVTCHMFLINLKKHFICSAISLIWKRLTDISKVSIRRAGDREFWVFSL